MNPFNPDGGPATESIRRLITAIQLSEIRTAIRVPCARSLTTSNADNVIPTDNDKKEPKFPSRQV